MAWHSLHPRTLRTAGSPPRPRLWSCSVSERHTRSHPVFPDAVLGPTRSALPHGSSLVAQMPSPLRLLSWLLSDSLWPGPSGPQAPACLTCFWIIPSGAPIALGPQGPPLTLLRSRQVRSAHCRCWALCLDRWAQAGLLSDGSHPLFPPVQAGPQLLARGDRSPWGPGTSVPPSVRRSACTATDCGHVAS